jgi:hypothetical protein
MSWPLLCICRLTVLVPQSNESNRGTSELVQHFRLYRRANIGARALLNINLIRLGYIARLSQRGGGDIHSFKLFLPAFATLRGRGGVSTL